MPEKSVNLCIILVKWMVSINTPVALPLGLILEEPSQSLLQTLSSTSTSQKVHSERKQELKCATHNLVKQVIDESSSIYWGSWDKEHVWFVELKVMACAILTAKVIFVDVSLQNKRKMIWISIMFRQ